MTGTGVLAASREPVTAISVGPVWRDTVARGCFRVVRPACRVCARQCEPGDACDWWPVA